MTKSVFQTFISEFARHLKTAYPFAQRLDKSFDVNIPKASSFYFGVSPMYGKHVIITFQHAPKSWDVGQFSINVHISEVFAPAADNWNRWKDRYTTFGDGFYRLATAAGLPDLWWCLLPDAENRPRDTSTGHLWEPDSYDDPAAVIQQAVREVCQFLEAHLLRKAGLTP